MARERFRKHINKLEDEMMDLGCTVAAAVGHAISALKNRDVDAAKKIVNDDMIINRKRWETEENCIELIALQQPVASDLREIVAIMNIITDLERIGDYAEGVAKIVILLGKEPLVKPLDNIPQMAEKGLDMLNRSIKAFIERDSNMAKKICDEDDEVDKLYDKTYHELLSRMIAKPDTITNATYLIWASHNFERIADRVTNICERTIFLVTGSMQKINVSKY
ncbi:MAG: phosphate signaling complex protein PhoU [Phycisphaerae bacterium]|jgi:phosphate transport system protein